MEKFVEYIVTKDSNYMPTYNPFAQLNDMQCTELIGQTKLRLNGRTNKITFDQSQAPPSYTIKALFSEIYDIRCKIFHGDESIYKFGARNLIDECNLVLERFLDICLNRLDKEKD